MYYKTTYEDYFDKITGCSFALGNHLEYIDPKLLSNRISSPGRESPLPPVAARMDTGRILYNNPLQLISEFRNGTFSNLYPLVSALRSLLPSVAVPEFEGYPNLALNGEFVNLALTRLVISSTANNFAGLDGFSQNVLECLRNPTNMRLICELQSTARPEAEAFAENLFYAAIESGNAGIVEYLLHTSGLDVNKLSCKAKYSQERSTPIQRAVRLGTREVIRALIRAKADPNKTLEAPYLSIGTLDIASMLFHGNVDLELVRMLLEAGATFDLTVLDRILFHTTPQAMLVVLLITFISMQVSLDISR